MKHKRVYQKIRLYKAHDLDLISFLDSHHMDFRKAVYCSLTAFAKGELFVIKIPPRIPNPGPLRRKYEFNLSLNPETDRAVIDMIDGITNGYKNNFIKNLLRMYLCTPISAEFLKDPSRISLFEEKFRMFKRGRRIADAAKVKRARTGRAAKHPEDRMADIFTQGEVPVPPLSAKPEPGSGTADKKEPWTEQAGTSEKKESRTETADKKQCRTGQEEIAEGEQPWPEPVETDGASGWGDAGEDLTDLFSSLLKS